MVKPDKSVKAIPSKKRLIDCAGRILIRGCLRLFMPRQDVDSDICERVKKLGYAPPQRVMLYGTEYEIVSDHFRIEVASQFA